MWRRLFRRNGLAGGVSNLTALMALCLPSIVVVLLLLNANDSFTQVDVEKQDLSEKVADLRSQLDHLRMVDQAKRKAFFDLQRQLQVIIDAVDKANMSNFFLGNLSRQALFGAASGNGSPQDFALRSRYNNAPEADNRFGVFASDKERRQFIANMSASALNPFLSIPNIFDYLPHLLQWPDALNPASRVSASGPADRHAHLVIGIPTIKRPKVSYLVQTLRSLLDALSPTEKQEVVVVVFMGELDGLTEWAQESILLLRSEFPEALDSGLLEVIVPNRHYYPDLSNIPATFNDSPERMIWRTKQNLDYAYLMMYCQSRGRYYMQLEDDVLTKTNFYQTMKDFTAKQNDEVPNWFLLEFSSLGFIGKMFKTLDLPRIIDFILLFYKDKPVDWLLDSILHVQVCNPEKSPKICEETKKKYRIRHKPSLFQHTGMHSSLKGKIQKLKEKDFGKQALHRPHSNPPATVSTSLKTYQKYTIDKAYAGETFFWGLLPQPGDWIKIELTPPLRIESLVFRSGNAEHPDDMFYNTSLEIKATNPADVGDFERTDDGFSVVAWFNQLGSAVVSLNTSGAVEAVRLVVHSESVNWAILNELWVKPMPDAWTEPIVVVPEPALDTARPAGEVTTPPVVEEEPEEEAQPGEKADV